MNDQYKELVSFLTKRKRTSYLKTILEGLQEDGFASPFYKKMLPRCIELYGYGKGHKLFRISESFQVIDSNQMSSQRDKSIGNAFSLPEAPRR